MLLSSLVIVAYFAICIGVGVAGQKRSMGFLAAFLLSALLTPAAGILFVAMSKTPKEQEEDCKNKLID